MLDLSFFSVVLAITGVLLLVSVLVNRVSDRFGVPVLLMFLGVGMLAGSDGIGGIHFDNSQLANIVGVISLSFILFSGGMDTEWRQVKPILRQASLLATLGVGITAGVTGIFVHFLLDWSWPEALLLGAIVSSTDAAAVFSVLRAGGVSLRGKLKPLLELESGSNDPMAVFLTLGILGIAMANNITGNPWMKLLPGLVVGMGVGLVTGLGVGKIAVFLLSRLRLGYEGLYPVLSISFVFIAYGLASILQGNGFLSVYVCGLVLGNCNFARKRDLTRFHDGLSWLMQVALFLTLGLLAYPSRLPTIAGMALLISLFLMFVARPVSVYLCLIKSGFTFAEKTFIAWTGLRGAVPIVLATYPFMMGYQYSETLFDMVFFIVFTSALCQGKSLMLVARLLRVDAPICNRPKNPLVFEKDASLQGDMYEVEIPPNSICIGRALSEKFLPQGILLLLVHRGAGFFVPKGETSLQAYDVVTLLGPHGVLPEAEKMLSTIMQEARSEK